jgi:hypothetical protein
MEKVTAEQPVIEVFENDIDLYLRQFQEEQEIEDMRTVPQSVWNGALMYVNRHLFKNNSHLLKSKDNIYNTNIINNNMPMYTNYNMYNYDVINQLLDYYIYICSINNKEISIMGFSKLTGIDTDTINSWGNNENKLSSSCSVIYKKLCQMREESLSNKLADGRQNPVGVIAMLNRHYGWASPYTSDSRNKQQIGADGLRELGQSKPPNFVQIEQKQEPAEQ